MKLLLVTDAWHPQVNGVVRTLHQLRDGLITKGWQVEVLGPSGLTVPCPSYSEIRLSLEPLRHVRETFLQFRPSAVHIATEGPLGIMARRFCVSHGLPFTTSFHTRFPEYLKLRYLIPRRWTYKFLLSFHRPAERVLVPTFSIKQELDRRGFRNVELWSRGVDTALFHPQRRAAAPLPFARPIQLYVGRLAVEKNIEAFLNLNTAGTQVIIGDGPDRARLKARFPRAVFLGSRFGQELAEFYAGADVFVFPSLTDTFGLVMLEALASGTPVAAFKAPGPKDVITDARIGVLAEGATNLESAIDRALKLDRHHCRSHALFHSWDKCIEQFASALVQFTDHSADHQGVGSPRKRSVLLNLFQSKSGVSTLGA